MENHIFGVLAGYSKTMVVRHDELWLSRSNEGSLEKFEKAVNKTGLLKAAYKIPFSAIREVSFNEASGSAKIKFINDKGEEKKLNIGFSQIELSNQFGNYLGEKLAFKKSSVQEGQTKPIVIGIVAILITIGSTYFLASLEDTGTIMESSGRRSGSKAILKLVVDTIGPTGVFILGGLVTLYLCYELFTRFKNPANEVLFTK